MLVQLYLKPTFLSKYCSQLRNIDAIYQVLGEDIDIALSTRVTYILFSVSDETSEQKLTIKMLQKIRTQT